MTSIVSSFSPNSREQITLILPSVTRRKATAAALSPFFFISVRMITRFDRAETGKKIREWMDTGMRDEKRGAALQCTRHSTTTWYYHILLSQRRTLTEDSILIERVHLPSSSLYSWLYVLTAAEGRKKRRGSTRYDICMEKLSFWSCSTSPYYPSIIPPRAWPQNIHHPTVSKGYTYTGHSLRGLVTWWFVLSSSRTL